MLKQWKNNNLDIIYFFVPNAKNNEILTTDGVLIPYAEFKTMTSEAYASKKNTNGGYDYDLSRKSERLVKKVASNPQIQKSEKTNTQETSNKSLSSMGDFSTNSNQIIKKTILNNSVEKPIKTVQEVKHTPKIENIQSTPKTVQKVILNNQIKETTTPKTVISKPTPTVSNIEKKINDINEQKKIENKKTDKSPFNLFDFLYPKLMLILAVICSVLSIYFTGTYLQRLQSKLIAYSISTAMLIYGLVGTQIARRSLKSKHKLQAFIYSITAIFTVGFSMLSSIDVNYAKYKVSHTEIEQEYNFNDGAKISYDLLKDELESNKKQIDLLNEDIKFQQTQWSIIWDNELNKNVVLEGRISSTAQQKITDDNSMIKELTDRNKEINAELRSYAESGISVEVKETKTDRAKSLTDLIGSIFGISGNIIQLIFLLVPSFFIDIINILAVTIYCQKFEEKKKED